jgi:hypothetical protein
MIDQIVDVVGDVVGHVDVDGNGDVDVSVRALTAPESVAPESGGARSL